MSGIPSKPASPLAYIESRAQEPGQPPRITPLSLLRNVTSSGEGQAAWPRDLLESVMSSINRAERASPASSRLLMSALPTHQPLFSSCCIGTG